MSAQGIDISSWQHPASKPIDFHAVAESGRTFLIIKATQGVSYTNPWFDRDYEDAFAAGLLVGAYHFFDPSVDATAQAQHFVGTLMGKQLDIGAWLDFEPPPAPAWTAAGWVNGFLEAAKDGRPGTGLYCDLSWWAELKGANVSPARLWLAAPGSSGPVDGATIVQTGTGTVPGVPAAVDLDELVVTRSINLPSAPPPKPAPDRAAITAALAQAVDDDEAAQAEVEKSEKELDAVGQ